MDPPPSSSSPVEVSNTSKRIKKSRVSRDKIQLSTTRSTRQSNVNKKLEPITTDSSSNKKLVKATTTNKLPSPLTLLPKPLLRLTSIFSNLVSILLVMEHQRQVNQRKIKSRRKVNLPPVSMSFSSIKQSVLQSTKYELDLMDLIFIYHLIPNLTRLEFKEVTRDFDSELDRDWSHPNQDTDYHHLHTSHILFQAESTITNLDRVTNIYFLIRSENSGPIPAPKRKKIDPSSLMSSKLATLNENFHQACDEFVTANNETSEADDLYGLLLQQARQYLPSHIIIDAVMTPSSPELPSEPLTLKATLAGLWKQGFFQGQVDFQQGIFHIPARLPQFEPLQVPLSEISTSLLPKTGLYSHQSEALNHLLTPSNTGSPDGIIISTPTASGKSFVYQLAVIERLISHPLHTTALIVVPTKALANDQIASFRRILNVTSLDWIKVGAYDGDTPQEIRSHLRSTCHIIFTNPDMLHYSILPYANSVWSSFLSKLAFLVIDEIHVYSSLFGQHVSLILRRLLRWCCYNHLAYSSLRIIGCSATISQPVEHLSRLIGLSSLQIKGISQDGSPSGYKKIILWNSGRHNMTTVPPLKRHLLTDAVEVVAYFLTSHTRSLVFCHSRLMCENIKSQLDNYLQLRYPPSQVQVLSKKVSSYRGGYSVEERKNIEARLLNNELTVVISTNALELGIDIGHLDAVISIGLPEQFSSIQQQMGRAGRRGQDSLMLIVYNGLRPGEGTDGAFLLSTLSNNYQKTPDAIQPSEPNHPFFIPDQVLLPPEIDPHILELHLQCAAKEHPIWIDSDTNWFGSQLHDICTEFLDGNVTEGYICKLQYREFPSQRIDIRGANTGPTFALFDTCSSGSPLEELEMARAMYSIYEGAIYLYRGKRYRVDHINTRLRYALLKTCPDVFHLTKPNGSSIVTSGFSLQSRNLLSTNTEPVMARFGPIKLIHTFTGYRRIHPRTNEVLEELQYSHISKHTMSLEGLGIWVDVPRHLNPKFTQCLAHILINAIHNLFGVLAQDIVTNCCHIPNPTTVESSNLKTNIDLPPIIAQPTTPYPHRLFIYSKNVLHQPLLVDPYSGIFTKLGVILAKALELLTNCSCQDFGCCSCIYARECYQSPPPTTDQEPGWNEGSTSSLTAQGSNFALLTSAVVSREVVLFKPKLLEWLQMMIQL